ncbi:hypothetical protein [Paenibacillus agricola]|uniref:Uncharacterized protein n=1 Tax=Paenibacillus agricola TaxID=2716264 RepID=A0ABX0JAH4_9BACL|nr:hypothetical protein [Paenibacillus agricola]NHN33455.1 hypothetical protein [Paenibacillus agricola]
MEIRDEKCILNEDELQKFETFLQYGNLKDAKYVFVGMEEGLWRFNYQENIQSRIDFLNHHTQFVHYLNEEMGFEGGWYVTNTDDSLALLTAINGNLEKRGLSVSWEVNRRIDQTMRMQIRLAALLEANLDFSNRQSFRHNDDYTAYRLHKRGGQTAMIDWYPLPKKSKADFPYSVPGKFENSKEYYQYYDTQDTNRKRIIRLQKHYEDLGFNFKKFSTGSVPSNFDIKPSKRSRDFMIGHRERKDGHVQLTVMTPFFGMGQFSYNDIDVMAAWIYSEKAKKQN